MNSDTKTDEALPVTDVANNYFPFHDGHVYAQRAELERLEKERAAEREKGSNASALMGYMGDEDRYYDKQRSALDRMFGR